MLTPTDLARLAMSSARDRRRALKRVVIGRSTASAAFEEAVKNALRSLGAKDAHVEVQVQPGPTRIIALELHRTPVPAADGPDPPDEA